VEALEGEKEVEPFSDACSGRRERSLRSPPKWSIRSLITAPEDPTSLVVKAVLAVHWSRLGSLRALDDADGEVLEHLPDPSAVPFQPTRLPMNPHERP
jgi:hypothetical protein